MREIKFRAWDKENNKMIYDCGITPDKIPYIIPEEADYSDEFCYYENSILMQFTNLFDCKQKEIYEEDIANITYICMRFSHWMEITDRGIMKWIDKSAQFSFEVNNSILNEEMKDLKIEVIGNIYENSELLKSEGYNDPSHPGT